jgi:hypothetical protein
MLAPVILMVTLGACSSTRPTPTARTLTVSCAAVSMNAIGQQSHCSAQVSRTDGSVADVTATATWTSSAPTAVTVAGGQIAAVAPGTADIAATFEGVTGHQAVSVGVACSFVVSPDAVSFSAGGGSQVVTVAAAPAGCSPSAWTAIANDAGVMVSPASGDGNGVVTVATSTNTTTAAQSHTTTIAGQTVTVRQSAPDPPARYTLHLTLVEGQTLSGPHAGTVSGPDGFTCTFGLKSGDGACTQAFTAGTSVRLTVKLAWPFFPPGAPVPDDRPIAFTTGCDAVVGGDTCLVNLTGDRDVTIGVGTAF